MNELPVVFGAPSSVYVRTVRLTLSEKDVPYRLVPVEVFDAPFPAEHLGRQPFGRIPAFEYEAFKLYETSAISRYIDEAFPGPQLQSGSPADRARMNQVIGIMDSYAYRTLVWDIYVERISVPRKGHRATDEARVLSALPRANICLLALDRIMAGGQFLAGTVLTLADLHAAPMFAYFIQASEGEELLSRWPALRCWWLHMRERRSMQVT